MYMTGSGSVAAIARHPLHPLIVPIPIGALVLAFVSDVLSMTTDDATYIAISSFLLLAGIITSVLAAVLGIIEMMGVSRARTMGLAWAHGGLNVLALILATISYLTRWSFVGDDAPTSVGGFQVTLTGIVAVLLLVSGWIGGEMSYKHGVGVAESIGGDRTHDPELDPLGDQDIGRA
jgi:uncharacterized membrane protein